MLTPEEDTLVHMPRLHIEPRGQTTILLRRHDKDSCNGDCKTAAAQRTIHAPYIWSKQQKNHC